MFIILKFINTCDRFRKTQEGENNWQQMIRTKKQITEQLFLKLCNVKEVLDEGELWQEYKDNAIKQGDPIKYYKSSNGLYFFQTAGFEFIFA